MHNLSDQELDRLSKEAAEKYEAAASPVLWDKILQRLDAEMPEKKKDKRRFFWLYPFAGLVLLTLTVGISVMYDQGNKSTEIKHVHQISGTEKSINPDNENQNEKDNVNILKKEFNDQSLIGNQAEPDIKKEVLILTKKEKKVDEVNNLPETISRPITQAKNKNGSKNIKTVAKNTTLAEQTEKDNNIPIAHTTTAPTGQTEKDQQASILMADSEQRVLFPARQDSLSETAATVTESTGKEKTGTQVASLSTGSKTGKKTMPINRFEIAAIFGPDFSNVGFTSPDKTGFNIGLMAGYRFTERLSVQAGLMYSEKHYTAVGNAYKVFPGYNLNNPSFKMNYVQANCFMWDMPVNLRYDWLLRKKQRAFMSTGLSTYFMNKEDLHYHYTFYGNYRYKALVNDENASYWLAAVNFSIGYEQKISRFFSVQAEPFIKIPAGEIGYGKINLNTLGILFSIKYSPAPFLFKNKKKM